MASGKFGHIASAQPGDIKYFAAAAAPPGWIKANGASVSRTAYASLFAAIGTAYGAGDGSTTFNLPDLRGEFVRGWDDGRGVDAGRSFGTAQLDQMQRITGSFGGARSPGGSVPNLSGALTQTGVRDIVGPGTADAGDLQFNSANSPDARASDTTDGETRSRNIALLACIKY